jgi:hypothetical protein
MPQQLLMKPCLERVDDWYSEAKDRVIVIINFQKYEIYLSTQDE